MDAPPLLWVGFNAVVLALLLTDLLVIHRDAKVVGPKEAGLWTAIWSTLSLLFCGGIAVFWDPHRAADFLTGYVMEYALSVDNLFVFLLVFTYFRVPAQYQRRLLFWGVLGAFVMRASLILVGTALVQRVHWVLYIFGAFLLYTAGKMLFAKDEAPADPEKGLPLRLARRFLPVSREAPPGHFFTQEDGKLRATPFFLVLVVVEVSDLIFAFDSIPAVMAVTQKAFIVYSSNVCAILGLRSLYFLVASFMDKFRYLKMGLAFVLGFVGLKLLGDRWITVPTVLSLAIVIGIIAASMIVSWWMTPAGTPTDGSGPGSRSGSDDTSGAS